MRLLIKAVGIFLLVFFGCTGGSWGADYLQLPGVVHVHSTVGSGLYSMEELVTLAKETGLEVLVVTDHDLVRMEYGVFPLRNLIKKRLERNSILKLGPEKYLAAIAQVNQRQKDVLVVPGVQSSPFYYWTGSPIGGQLTAHHFRKELLLIGMMSPEDYRELPLMHRGFSTRYVKELLSQSIVFLLSFFMGIYLFFQRGYLKTAGIIIALLSLALLINYHPFQSSRFDPYQGDPGIAPYQDLIDYVNERGGLTFWAHPESNYSKSGSKLGPIKLMTAPHVDSLLEAKNYTGFSTIHEDAMTLADPGKNWDQLLNQYCSGRRSQPVWGIAGAHFYGEAMDARLDTFQTIFIAKSKSVPHIVDALAKGRVYAKRKEKGAGLTMDRFSVQDAGTGKTAIMGDELNISTYPVIGVKVDSDDQIQHAVKVLLVKGGVVIHQFEGETPLEFVIEDKSAWVGKSYYRLEVQSPSAGTLLTNPIFVDRKIALGAGTEHHRMLKTGDVDKTVVMEKKPAEPAIADRKPESYSGEPVYKIGEPLPVQIAVQSTISDKRAESRKEVKSAWVDTPGLISKLPDSELKITANPVPYSVQIASFSSFEMAQKSLQDFQKIDLPVYHVKVNLGDKGTWWRLYAGCFPTQAEAAAARETYHLPESVVQKTSYANLVDMCASPEEISVVRQRLEAMQYGPYVIRKTADCYHLYVGAFITLKGAKDLQRELRTKCIATKVVER